MGYVTRRRRHQRGWKWKSEKRENWTKEREKMKMKIYIKKWKLYERKKSFHFLPFCHKITMFQSSNSLLILTLLLLPSSLPLNNKSPHKISHAIPAAVAAFFIFLLSYTFQRWTSELSQPELENGKRQIVSYLGRLQIWHPLREKWERERESERRILKAFNTHKHKSPTKFYPFRIFFFSFIHPPTHSLVLILCFTLIFKHFVSGGSLLSVTAMRWWRI